MPGKYLTTKCFRTIIVLFPRHKSHDCLVGTDHGTILKGTKDG
jgi:hypothetical protein